MFFRIFRPFFAVVLLLAAASAAIYAQRPLPADSSGRIGWPIPMTPKQHIAASTVFGATMGMLVGGTAGWATAMGSCPEQDRRLFGCDRPSELPKYAVGLGVGGSAYLSAVSAAMEAGCERRDARRRSRRGAVRGLVVGIVPLLAYHLADGRDERVEWTLALAGSGYQAASVARSTWGCLDAR